MRGKYKFLLLALLIAFASCSFTSKVDAGDGDKDKLLVRLITYLLDQGHFAPQDINDEFSVRVYDDYINQLDPFKRYFYESDIKEFETYKNKLDDQLKAYELSFFDMTHKRLIDRISESKEVFDKILNKPFDYTKDEAFNSDYDELDYPKSKRDMKERWRKQLKFSTIANYDEAIENNNIMVEQDDNVALKSEKELEAEARETTRKSLEELYTYMEERQRKDWFGVYINAVVSEFDPHTFYFKPEDKDRFDRDMSGKYEGIGARLQRKLDIISISELISGGPA